MIGFETSWHLSPEFRNHRPQILLMFLQAKRAFAAALFPALVTISCFAQSAPGNAFEGIQIELPANGNIRVENQFGGVAAEVWKEKYVSVSATIEGPRPFARSHPVWQGQPRVVRGSPHALACWWRWPG